MPKKYPPLSYKESVGILKALGFTFKNTQGSHEHWIAVIGGIKRKVTLDINCEYTDLDIKSHIAQAGVSREAYYGATSRTAKKI